MKELDINKEYNNGGSLYLEDGYLYKVYNEISYFRDEKERNIKFLMNNDVFFNEMIKDIEDIRLELVLTRTSKIIYN